MDGISVVSFVKEENKIWVCVGGFVDEFWRVGFCFFKRMIIIIMMIVVIFMVLLMFFGWVFEFLVVCSVGDGKKVLSFFEGIGGVGWLVEDVWD